MLLLLKSLKLLYTGSAKAIKYTTKDHSLRKLLLYIYKVLELYNTLWHLSTPDIYALFFHSSAVFVSIDRGGSRMVNILWQ